MPSRKASYLLMSFYMAIMTKPHNIVWKPVVLMMPMNNALVGIAFRTIQWPFNFATIYGGFESRPDPLFLVGHTVIIYRFTCAHR